MTDTTTPSSTARDTSKTGLRQVKYLVAIHSRVRFRTNEYIKNIPYYITLFEINFVKRAFVKYVKILFLNH